MLSYESKKEELAQLKIEAEDEINYYKKKIEEFNKKIDLEKRCVKNKKEELDQYVLKNYQKDKLKAWVHFMTTQRTKISDDFFGRFFKNTGIGVSKSNINNIKIIFKPHEALNIKKTAETITVLFEMAKRQLWTDFNIEIIDIKSTSNEKYFIYKSDKDQSFFVKQEDKKRAKYRENSALVLIGRLMKRK